MQRESRTAISIALTTIADERDRIVETLVAMTAERDRLAMLAAENFSLAAEAKGERDDLRQLFLASEVNNTAWKRDTMRLLLSLDAMTAERDRLTQRWEALKAWNEQQLQHLGELVLDGSWQPYVRVGKELGHADSRAKMTELENPEDQ